MVATVKLRSVTVVRLVSAGTIEEDILALHQDKRELCESLLGEGDAAATLSTQQLAELLALRRF